MSEFEEGVNENRVNLIHSQHYSKLKYWIKTRVPLHYKVAVVAWISRLISGVAQLASVAIILRYLGTHFYALFALMTGLQGWFALSDLGLGASVQNAISTSRVQQKDVTPILSNAFTLLLGVTLSLLLLYSVIFISLQRVLFGKIAPMLAHSHYELFLVLGFMYILTYTWSVVYRILLANRQGYLAYIYQGLGPLLSLITIGTLNFFPSNGVNRLLAMLIAWIAPPALVVLICALYYFPFRQIKAHWNKLLFQSLLYQALRFFSLNIIGVFVTSIDYVVMSQTVNTVQITIYNILAKGYGVIYFVYMAILLALWPEVAELFGRKEWLEANRLLKRTIFLGMCFLSISTLGIVMLRDLIISILAPHSGLSLPIDSIFLFGLYYAVVIWTATYSMALQSQNYLKVFWSSMSLQAAISVFCAYYFSVKLGINGILGGLTLASLLTTTWMLPVVYWKRKGVYDVS